MKTIINIMDLINLLTDKYNTNKLIEKIKQNKNSLPDETLKYDLKNQKDINIMSNETKDSKWELLQMI